MLAEANVDYDHSKCKNRHRELVPTYRVPNSSSSFETIKTPIHKPRTSNVGRDGPWKCWHAFPSQLSPNVYSPCLPLVQVAPVIRLAPR